MQKPLASDGSDNTVPQNNVKSDELKSKPASQ